MRIDQILFLIVGLFFSFFYGLRSYFLFTRLTVDAETRELYEKTLTYKIHNFFVNFTGSAIGWIALYLVYNDLLAPGFGAFSAGKINLGHVFLLFIALMGIWGILPHTFWGLASSAKYMAEKALGRLK